MTRWRRPSPLDDIDNEVEAHLEMAELDLLRQGVPPDEARRLARVQFGNLRLMQDDARAAAGWPRLEALVLDARYALRRLTSDPSTSWMATLLLAVAIGLGAAMFTVADALLLRPSPFPHPDTLVQVWAGDAPTDVTPNIGIAAYKAMRGAPGIPRLHMAGQRSALFDDGTMEVRRPGARITVGLLEELGVRPIRGRTFTDEDARDGTPVIISERMWRRRFGSDPEILGRQLVVSGEPAVVIGILPATFVFPTSGTEIWFPFDPDVSPVPHGSGYVYGRIGRDQPVTATVTAFEHALRRGGAYEQAHVRLRPMSQSSMDPYSAGLVRATSLAVALVFLVLCANAAALLLTGAQRRRRLYALSAMLGAPWGRLLRQAVIEQLVIVSGGILGGLVLAWYLVEAARVWLPQSLVFTSLNLLDLDARAVAAAALLGGVALLACGVAPAWFGRRRYAAPHGDLVARGIGTERVAGRAPMLALVAQTTLAILLCVGASVQWRSLVTMSNVSPGIDVQQLAWFDVKLPPDMGAAVLGRVQAEPAVENATLSFGTFPRASTSYYASVTTDAPAAVPSLHHIESVQVTGEFFDVYGIDIERGRALAATDAPDAVVISRSLASRLWPDGDAVGRTFRFDGDRAFTVVGIASEVLNPLVDPRNDDPEMYEVLPTGTSNTVERHLTVRCRQACGDLTAIRQAIVDAAPGLRVSAGTLTRDDYALGLARPRAAALLAGTFGIVGTGAAAIGLFIVLARTAASRQREYGIRLALGAAPARLAAQIGLTSARVVAGALVASAILAWPLGRVLSGVQHGTSISDPWAWTMAIAAVVIAATAATARPARQAARVDPAALLRDA